MTVGYHCRDQAQVKTKIPGEWPRSSKTSRDVETIANALNTAMAPRTRKSRSVVAKQEVRTAAVQLWSRFLDFSISRRNERNGNDGLAEGGEGRKTSESKRGVQLVRRRWTVLWEDGGEIGWRMEDTVLVLVLVLYGYAVQRDATDGPATVHQRTGRLTRGVEERSYEGDNDEATNND
ncbi:hypothetical protein CHU98_g5189 [Xylaria longipes]|nr:hypothetical protein CHU98_g5189 [Xylaria longipes]